MRNIFFLVAGITLLVLAAIQVCTNSLNLYGIAALITGLDALNELKTS